MTRFLTTEGSFRSETWALLASLFSVFMQSLPSGREFLYLSGRCSTCSVWMVVFFFPQLSLLWIRQQPSLANPLRKDKRSSLSSSPHFQKSLCGWSGGHLVDALLDNLCERLHFLYDFQGWVSDELLRKNIVSLALGIHLVSWRWPQFQPPWLLVTLVTRPTGDDGHGPQLQMTLRTPVFSFPQRCCLDLR